MCVPPVATPNSQNNHTHAHIRIALVEGGFCVIVQAALWCGGSLEIIIDMVYVKQLQLVCIQGYINGGENVSKRLQLAY